MTSKSIKNLIFGLMNQLLLIVIGFVFPKLFIQTFGSETNGLLASINQFVGYFSLIEAGLGAASLQALYSKVAIDDTEGMNSILAATHKSYKNISKYYAMSIILTGLLYPLVNTGKLGYTEVMVIILLLGLTAVVNFRFQGTIKVLLQAEGKTYVVSQISAIINILATLVKIYFLSQNYSLISVQLVQPFFNMIQILFFNVYILKNYTWIDYNVKPNYDAISQRKSVLVHQVATLVYNNTDILLLSFFVDLKSISVYAVYNSIMNMIIQLLLSISNSVTFVLGQTFSSAKEKFLRIFDIYETIFLFISFTVFSVVQQIFTPFMHIYLGNIQEVNYVNQGLVALFSIKVLLQTGRTPYRQMIEVSGNFRSTQKNVIIESVINILASIFFISKYGIYGAVIGTIVALVYRTIDMCIFTNKKIVKRNLIISISKWIAFFLISLFIMNFENSVEIEGILDFLILFSKKACMIILLYSVPTVLFLYSIHDRKKRGKNEKDSGLKS